MPSRVICPAAACRREIIVADELRGPTIRCPDCGLEFPTAAPPANTLSLPPPTVWYQATGPDTPTPAGGLPDLLPTRIGRFELRHCLGEGAFGVVYRAYDPRLDREVALKVAKPHTLNTKERVKRFLGEAKAAANLRHPHIVPVFDSGEDGNQYYIASAFIPCQSLASALDELPEGSGMDSRRAAPRPASPRRPGSTPTWMITPSWSTACSASMMPRVRRSGSITPRR